MHLLHVFAKWSAIMLSFNDFHVVSQMLTGLILGLHPANERWRYFVTMFLIGWAQMWNQPCVNVCYVQKYFFDPLNHIYIWQLSLQPNKIESCFNIKMLSYQYRNSKCEDQINALVQERCNSSALAMELRLSCTNPLRWSYDHLISTMGFLILARQHLYIESRPSIWSLTNKK